MHMVFIKHKGRIQFVSNKFKGTQTIQISWEKTIENLKDMYRPNSWEILEGDHD